MNADNLLDYLLDKLDNFINPYRRNLFITPEQRAVLIESIEAAERDAWNAAIEAVAQVCKKEAETSDWQECAALLDMSGEILKLRK